MPICGVPCSLTLKHHKSELFGSSQLLSQKTYVLIRACLACNSAFWIVVSVRTFDSGHWFIFLTHWAFALQTLYFSLSLVSAIHLWVSSTRTWGGGGNQAERVIARARKAVRRGRLEHKNGDDGEVTNAPSEHGRQPAVRAGDNALDLWWRLQWALLILSADAAIIVSVVYWTLLFDGWVGPLNFQLHLFNAVFMVLDVFIGAAPFEWKHIGITYVYGLVYLTFDVVYYIVGGHYNDRFQVIYTFLDWGKAPGKAMTVVVAILAIMVPLAHGMHVLVARYREKLRRDHPNWGWQGTEQEEMERVMEVSGMRDADVWAPLTAVGDDLDLYHSEEEEFGGRTAFYVGRQESKIAAVGKGTGAAAAMTTKTVSGYSKLLT